MTPEEGIVTDRLARGEAVPGGPGACGRDGCWHQMLWHDRHGEKACRRCGCPGYQAHTGPAATEGAHLLAQLHTALSRYVILPSAEAAVAVALWIAASHAKLPGSTPPGWLSAPRRSGAVSPACWTS